MAELPQQLLLQVATPHGLALKAQVRSVQAPSVWGEFGVLPGHLPLLASLKSGILRYQIENQEHKAAIGPGFAEVAQETMRILTEHFATPAEIDVKTTRHELEAAETKRKELAKQPDADPDELNQLDRQIAWCQSRLDVAADRL